MKRSFALIGFTYLITLVAAIYFGKQVSFYIAIALAACFLISLFFKDVRKNRTIPVALLVASVAMFVYVASYQSKIEPTINLDQQEVTISGTISEIPYKDYGKYYYTLETDSVSKEGSPQKLKLRLSSTKALEADVYDKITANVHMYKPSTGQGYTSRIYYQAQGIYILAYLNEGSEVQVEPVSNKPIYYYVIKARENLLESIRVMLPSTEASLVSGILLGSKREIPKDIQNDFREIGVTHMLVVSGMHLAIISQFLGMVLKAFNVKKKYLGIIISICIFMFMALTGFSSSVMRAGFMSMIYFGGMIFGKKPDSLNSLGLSVFVICLINPFAAADIGLLLSVMAVLGILLLADPIYKFIRYKIINIKKENSILNWIIMTFSVSLAATVFTSPISMIIFKRISIISPFANIIILAPIMLMTVFSSIALILYLINFSFIAVTFAAIAGIMADYMIWAAKILAEVPCASVPTNQGFVLLWLAFTLILLSLAFAFRNNTKLIRITAILSVIILLVGVLSYQISRRNVVSVAVIDTGNGVSTVLNTNNHTAVISSGGEDYRSRELSEYLESINSRELDYFLVSDSSEESSTYANSVIDKYSPYALTLCTDNDIEDKLVKRENLYNKVTYFNKNTTVDMWGKAKVYVKSLDQESYVYIEVNQISFLLSFKELNEENIPDVWKNPNFLITSSDIDSLVDIDPNYVVISKDLKKSTVDINKLAPDSPNIIATASDGTIVIDCIKDNYIDIRRVS